MRVSPCAALALLWAAPPAIAGAERPDTSEHEASTNDLTELWQKWRASGTARTNYYESSKSLDDETGFAGVTLQLKALPSIGERIDAKLETRLTNGSIGSGGSTRAQTLEAYVRIHFSRADLSLGKQIVAWGRADGLNPTDNLTPRDYTVMLPFEDDQRFGTPSAKLHLLLTQEHTLTLFAAPFFEPSRIPLPSGGLDLTEIRPATTPSNTAVGVKLDKAGEGFDWSVSYFRGFALLPGLRPALDATANDPAVELHYDRITVFGADFARNFGRFGFRGEMAYVDTADDSGTNPAIRNPFLHSIVGVDRTFYDNLNVNLQFFQRRVINHRDPGAFTDALMANVATLNTLINAQEDPVSNGISFRISNQWLNDTLEAEIFAAINVTRDNSFLRPLITYAFSDHWKGTLGAELYFGDADTQYGSQKENRGAFLELRYGFQ
jgi:hypothetical protein